VLKYVIDTVTFRKKCVRFLPTYFSVFQQWNNHSPAIFANHPPPLACDQFKKNVIVRTALFGWKKGNNFAFAMISFYWSMRNLSQ